MKYTKPPLRFEKQIELLESRGLIVPDKAKALHYLSNISYYPTQMGFPGNWDCEKLWK